VVLRYLPGVARRPIVLALSAVLVRLPSLPLEGRPGRLARRRLLWDAKAGGSRRRRALAAVGRVESQSTAAAALLVAEVRTAAGESALARDTLTAAAQRWPDVSQIRFALARSLVRAGSRAEGAENLLAALQGDLVGLEVDEVLDVAIEARSLEAIDAIDRILPTWPRPVEASTHRRIRQSKVIADAVDRHRNGEHAALAAVLTEDDLARIAVRWALAEQDAALLRTICAAIRITDLDASTAGNAAQRLRGAGDLSVSTALAEHALADRPTDVRLRRLVEVGHSCLRAMAEGWQPPPRTRGGDDRGQPRSIGYLLHNSLPYASAGYATRTHGLLSALVRSGWDVHGVTRLGYPYDRWDIGDDRHVRPVDVIDGVAYHRLVDGRHHPYPRWPLASYVDEYSRRVERIAKIHRIGVIHGASNYWNGFAAISAARKLGLPSVYEVRGLWELTRMSREPAYEDSEMFALTAQLEAEACLHADHVITITDALRDLMVERGVPASKITVVPNGVDTKRFVPITRDEQLARELGMEGKVVIGYVGSVLDYEGIDTLLLAIRKLREIRRDFHVLVVGAGDAYDQCLALRDHLKVADAVTFTGRVPHHEVERYYSLVDLAPFPRKPLPVCETVSPLKPFEAMASGKVPIVSSVAALTEIVTHDHNGLVFDKNDVDSLVELLDRAVGDDALRDRLGKAAREWVVRERAWSVLVRRLEDVYSNIRAEVASAAAGP
jgi:glycosyltransferase involved in cell wall biosynthesis